MNRRLWSKWSCICLIAVLALVAGCQAIGGVDLNKALLSGLDVNSLEGSSSFTLEFTLNDQAGPQQAEQLAILKALNPLKLNFDHVKMETRERLSLSGTLEISRGKIPFTAFITPEELVFKPEGAAKPFVLKLDELQSGSGAAFGPEQEKIVKELQTKVKDPEFLKPIYSYFINTLPNPKNIKLSNVTESIYGESVPLYKVETALNGTEALSWLKTYLVKLMQDDQGLKTVVAHLYDTLKPVFDQASAETKDSIIPSSPDAVYSEGPFGSLGETISNLMSDREAAIEVLHTEVKQVMVVILGALNQPHQENGFAVQDIFNDKSNFKANIYIDNGLKVRKSEAEVLLTVPESLKDSGIQSVKVTTVSSNWNVNKEVKADVIPSAGAYELGKGTQPAELLEQLDSGSVLYQFLKNDLHVTRKTVVFWPEKYDFMPPSMLTYSENGTTMAPARYLAEQLGAGIDWNGGDQTVTITDKRTGTVIVAVVGSTTAEVNGKPVELEVPATIHDGTLYVPLRFAAEALGAQVKWDEKIGTISVTIE